MTEPLRIGIAGVGTVGASLVNILQQKHNQLAQTCGRPITVTAVCARDKTKDRGCDLSNVEWFDDADELAQYIQEAAKAQNRQVQLFPRLAPAIHFV